MATFNNQTTTAFFSNAPQMHLSNPTRLRLSQEGLETVNDFADFKKEQLNQAIKNMRTPIPGIPAITDANGVVVTAAIPAVPPCIVSAKCSLRLQVASDAFHYYASIGRQPTPANMNYTNVLRSFYVEWEALIKMSNEAKPSVPVISKHQPPIKWIESFKDCLFRTYGVRNCPILYVIRENADTPPEVNDPLVLGCAYGRSGSILDELISRLVHTDPLFKSDNASVYSLLEEATRGTIYASTIKPYATRKNGRQAWLSMISSHAGNDKWEQLQKDKIHFMMNTKWNGRSFSLEKFTGLHRSSFVQLEEAATHVPFQLPSERTRVSYLVDNIANNDPDLRAALASIRINTNGMRDNFEQAVTFLLPVCPYAKHRASNGGGNQRNAQISDATLKGKQHSKTGVDLRWHTKSEYETLNKEQRVELYHWQMSKEGKAKLAKDRLANKGKQGNVITKKQLQAKIHSLEAQLSKQKDPTLDEISACIKSASVLPPAPSPVPIASPIAVVPPSVDNNPYSAAAKAVQGILKRKCE
jgi:hypothetical protein